MAETTKLGYGAVGDIESAIEAGTLDARDIIITSDSSEFVYVRDDNTTQFIRPRIRLFADEETANTTLNTDSDTYAGQIVGILDEDSKYALYIVQGEAGSFEVEAISASSGSTGVNWVAF